MDNAIKEVERASEFDYEIINDNFKICYAKFKKVIEDILISDSLSGP